MQPLEPPDSHYLSAAIGWVELGNWREAEEELNRINPAFRFRPDVLLAQYAIEAAAKNWNAAASTAQQVATLNSDEPGVWIAWAFAKRRSDDGGIEDARKLLLQAREKFPKEPIIAYNLACYECQLGRLDQAKSWLQTASKIGDRELIKRMALQDADLEPLRDYIARL